MSELSLFHVIAHDEQTDVVKHRKVAVACKQRLDSRFAAFVAQAQNWEQLQERLSYIMPEVESVVAVTREEFGIGDESHSAIISAWLAPFNQNMRASYVRTASIHEARKPRMCPFHKDVTDISLAAGDPRAGFDSMAQHWGGPRHCEGEGYKGESCKFKPEMTTQSYWDDRSEKLQQQRDEKAQREQEQTELEQLETPVEEIEVPEPEVDEIPIPELEVDSEGNTELEDALGQGVGEPEGELAPLALAASHGSGFQRFAPLSEYDKYFGGEPGAAAKAKKSMIEQYGEEKGESVFYATVNKKKKKSSDHTATEGTGLGGPVPTMDKRKWTPQAFDAPLPVDDSEGRHPTRHQDILEPVKPRNVDRRHPGQVNDIGGQVTEHQDVTKEWKNHSRGDQGGTFSHFASDDEIAEAIRHYKS